MALNAKNEINDDMSGISYSKTEMSTQTLSETPEFKSFVIEEMGEFIELLKDQAVAFGSDSAARDNMKSILENLKTGNYSFNEPLSTGQNDSTSRETLAGRYWLKCIEIGLKSIGRIGAIIIVNGLQKQQVMDAIHETVMESTPAEVKIQHLSEPTEIVLNRRIRHAVNVIKRDAQIKYMNDNLENNTGIPYGVQDLVNMDISQINAFQKLYKNVFESSAIVIEIAEVERHEKDIKLYLENQNSEQVRRETISNLKNIQSVICVIVNACFNNIQVLLNYIIKGIRDMKNNAGLIAKLDAHVSTTKFNRNIFQAFSQENLGDMYCILVIEYKSADFNTYLNQVKIALNRPPMDKNIGLGSVLRETRELSEQWRSMDLWSMSTYDNFMLMTLLRRLHGNLLQEVLLKIDEYRSEDENICTTTDVYSTVLLTKILKFLDTYQEASKSSNTVQRFNSLNAPPGLQQAMSAISVTENDDISTHIYDESTGRSVKDELFDAYITKHKVTRNKAADTWNKNVTYVTDGRNLSTDAQTAYMVKLSNKLVIPYTSTDVPCGKCTGSDRKLFCQPRCYIYDCRNCKKFGHAQAYCKNKK